MKPLMIVFGSDKGGVGKTTLARTMDDYLQTKHASRHVYDCEFPSGDLSRFVASSRIIDAMDVDDQMKVFDSMQGVTLLDVKAGLFTAVLEKLKELHFLDDVADGKLNLLLMHVLGPTVSSLREIAHVTESLGPSVHHVLVKNYVDVSGYEEWEKDSRFASTLKSARTIVVPHLSGRVCTEIQRLGVSFVDYTKDEKSSYVIKGLLRTWLAVIFAAYDGAGVKELVEEAA